MKLRVTVCALMLGTVTSVTWADVASRVAESNSNTHKGVLAYVHDASARGLQIERYFFGQGLTKVASAAPGFQIQIVAPMDIPGGALPGSFVVLTPLGHRVVAMQRGYNTISDLRSFVAPADDALQTYSALSTLPPIAKPISLAHALIVASSVSGPDPAEPTLENSP